MSISTAEAVSPTAEWKLGMRLGGGDRQDSEEANPTSAGGLGSGPSSWLPGVPPSQMGGGILGLKVRRGKG